jgi:hypothetical protein
MHSVSDYLQPTSVELNDRSTRHGIILNNIKYDIFRLTARCGLEVISCVRVRRKLSQSLLRSGRLGNRMPDEGDLAN